MAKFIPAPSTEYKVVVSPSKDGVRVVVGSCPDLDQATAVALQFHQLSNLPHVVSVVLSGDDLVVLTRLEKVLYKPQSNGR